MNQKACHFTLLLCSAQVLVITLLLVLCPSAGAQDLLRNGDFEEALGPMNWTVGYVRGVPADFEIKGRSRGGSHAVTNGYGGYFRPLTSKEAHAYFTQTVTNLTPNHVYKVSGWMREDGWRDPVKSNLREWFLVYVEAIGGRGDATPDGRASVRATTPADDKIDAPYTYPTSKWRKFTAEQTPDASGKIEVRLHYEKVRFTIYDAQWLIAASYDDFTLIP